MIYMDVKLGHLFLGKKVLRISGPTREDGEHLQYARQS